MRKLILAAASVAALALAGPASAQSPIVIKFSHVVATEHAEGPCRRKIQGTGREIHRRQGEGRSLSELAALQGQGRAGSAAARRGADAGAVELPSSARSASRNSRCSICPTSFPTCPTLRKVTDGPLGAKLLKLLEPKGMTGLAYWDNGFKKMSANKKLVTPADYKGLKFRIQSSKVLEAQFRALGVDPAGDGVLGSLSGAADRRRRRAGEHLVEHLHPENARSAEVHHRDQSRLYRLRRGREQEVLGRPAGRRSRAAAKRP